MRRMLNKSANQRIGPEPIAVDRYDPTATDEFINTSLKNRPRSHQYPLLVSPFSPPWSRFRRALPSWCFCSVLVRAPFVCSEELLNSLSVLLLDSAPLPVFSSSNFGATAAARLE